jgi:flavin-dependent dehydrogenase
LPQGDRFADVVVAGAGPAGATIATLLATRGKRVKLIDPGTQRTERLEIIAPAGMPVIQALNLTRLLDDPATARPCLGIRRRWGTITTEIDDFLCHPGGRGFVVERARFDNSLRALAAEAGVTFVTGRVVAAQRNAGVVTATIKTCSTYAAISARIVVDATGRASTIARKMGARRLRSESLIAERCQVDQQHYSSRDSVWLDVEGSEKSWSYQVSGPDGRQERWMVYRPTLQTSRPSSHRTDASSACLSPAAGDGWIAIGDAVTSFDPITSQGLMHALTTSLVAAGAILSPERLNDEACRIYTGAVAATFRSSEIGRTNVYSALAAKAWELREQVSSLSPKTNFNVPGHTSPMSKLR